MEDALAEWLAPRVEHLVPPLQLTRIGAGQSNVTSLVTADDGRQWVLRRPPPGTAPGTHDVGRESRILQALAGTVVPVPAVVAEGTDEACVDGPFLVMERVAGVALAGEREARAVPPDERRRIGDHAVAVLADLHGIDPDAVGLGALGRRTGGPERRIARTGRSWAAWGAASPADPAWQECRRRLSRSVPARQRYVIAHGDYRLSNLLVADGRVTAVLDWELCTLGDPLVDLAWLVDDWRSPDEAAIAIPSPTRVGGFATRDEVVEQYARRTGLDCEDLRYHRAFTHWKAATLLQGVLLRRRSGSLGEHGAIDLLDLQHTVHFLLDEALDLVGR